MCAPHWRRVPKPLQLAVYRTWRARAGVVENTVLRRQHRDACVAAVEAVHAALGIAEPVRRCKNCGCTEWFACPDGGCYWVECDLCSECV